jgi:Sulfotransferase domain
VGRRREVLGGRLARSDNARRVIGRAKILPSFLVIGAQRAGTTSLFDLLLRHPDLFGPVRSRGELTWARKEIHFFDERFLLGENWYRSFFPLALTRRRARARGGDVVAGEATPYYIFHPLVAERVAVTIPDVRLIAILRDPVERAYSHYQMMRRSSREDLSFEEALAAESERLASEDELEAGTTRFRIGTGERRKHYHHRHHSYFARGLYAEQLERWLAHFQREQLLVLTVEDLSADGPETIRRVLDFLGVRQVELTAPRVANRASYEPMPRATRAELEQRYAEPNERLERLLGRTLEWGPRRPTTTRSR